MKIIDAEKHESLLTEDTEDLNNFHDLRRTFASLHAQCGTPIFHIARWLGDDPSVVEQVYAHLTPNSERINGPWAKARENNSK